MADRISFGRRFTNVTALLMTLPTFANADPQTSKAALETARAHFKACSAATTQAASDNSHDTALQACMVALSRIEQTYSGMDRLTEKDRSNRDFFRASAAYLTFASELKHHNGLTRQACRYGALTVEIVEQENVMEEKARQTVTAQADLLRESFLPICASQYPE